MLVVISRLRAFCWLAESLRMGDKSTSVSDRVFQRLRSPIVPGPRNGSGTRAELSQSGKRQRILNLASDSEAEFLDPRSLKLSIRWYAKGAVYEAITSRCQFRGDGLRAIFRGVVADPDGDLCHQWNRCRTAGERSAWCKCQDRKHCDE